MADTTIWDLTAETVMTAAHRIPVQDTSSATTAQYATHALLGGLEVDTTFDTAADHADISGVVGQLHLVDLSALASEVIFRLPTTAQVGERIGVYITVGSTTDGEELAIRTTAASNDTINGVDHDTADWSRLFITGESLIFRCITANTDWIVEHDGRIPCVFRATLASTLTTNSASTWETVGFDTAATNVGNVYDTTGEQFSVRRTASWVMTCNIYTNSTYADGDVFGCRLRSEADDRSFALDSVAAGGTGNSKATLAVTFEAIHGSTTNGSGEIQMLHTQTNRGILASGNTTNFYGTEIL
jgi:hypothetical protein